MYVPAVQMCYVVCYTKYKTIQQDIILNLMLNLEYFNNHKSGVIPYPTRTASGR